MKVTDYQSSKILEQPRRQNTGGRNLEEGFDAEDMAGWEYLGKQSEGSITQRIYSGPTLLKVSNSYFQNKRDSSLVKISYMHSAITFLVDSP